MDNISDATILTLSVSIFIAALNVSFGIHGRLKKFTNERISVYKEISSLEDDTNQLSEEKIVAKQKLKAQVLYELTKIKDVNLASFMLEVMKNNPNIDNKKEISIRTVIDCVDKEITNMSPSVTNTELLLNGARFRKKRKIGFLHIAFNVVLAIIFSQAAFSFSESRGQIPLALASGVASLFMLGQYTLCLLYYPVLGTFNHYDKIIKNLVK